MELANPFSSITASQLDDLVARLTTHFRPRAVYLFGSHALGVPHRDSDIDVMVIVEEDPPGAELYRRGSAAVRGLSLSVELHFCSQRRFERFGGVVGSLQHEIKRKGVLLYAAQE